VSENINNKIQFRINLIWNPQLMHSLIRHVEAPKRRVGQTKDTPIV
jgi:hypothetical protein